MYRFWNSIIEPILTMLDPRIVVEIGSDRGDNTVRLLEFCKNNDTVLHAVDPVPSFDVESMQERYDHHFVFHRSLSLNAIPRIKAPDVFLIDGDHNWYTVFNELKLIEKGASDYPGLFPVILIHDIGWPYGRRDLYYNPDTIPQEFRKPYRQKGVHPDSAELLERGGLNPHLNNSIYENDLQSGVLTAVEDFLKETDRPFEFVKIPGLSGLGILVTRELWENNEGLRTFLESLHVGQPLTDYIQEIEKAGVLTMIALHDTELLVSTKNQEIKRIKEERAEKVQQLNEERTREILTLREGQQREIQKLREEQQCEVQKLREGQQREVQKLREDQKQEMDKLRREQILAAERLKIEIEKRDQWVHQITYDISELLQSKRWKMGVAIGELYRKVLLKPRVPTAADHIQRLLAKTPAKQSTGNQLLQPSSKKKAPELKPRQALQFVLSPEEAIPKGPVTVIVPVFNALEDVKRCLESVLHNTPLPHEILLIDDGSSDERIAPLLQSYVEKDPRIRLITNPRNLGYTRTINIGCRSCLTDVVLLNSDTLVTPLWIDRLRESAYRKKATGTVTPVSNNAGAFSVPEINSENELPAGYTLNSYAEFISRLGIRHLPEVMTGSGFCLYIKRSVMDAIGLFDEEHFPIGYGEENDFCLRALKAGFKNVIDDSVYIYHRREASFGNDKPRLNEKARVQLRDLHPECDAMIREFQDNHPLSYFSEAARNAMPIEEASRDRNTASREEQERNTLLFIIHDGGGGSVFTTWDLAKSVPNDFRCLVMVCGKTQWNLYEAVSGEEIHQFNFDIAWNPIDPIDALRLSMLKYICRTFDVSIVHIRSLIGLSPEVFSFLKYLDLEVIFSFHDLYTLCPTIHLIDDRGMFCGGDCSPGRGACLVSNRWYHAIPDLKHGYVYQWRHRMESHLRFCDAFITTSDAARDVIQRHYPGLRERDFFIIEHGRDITRARASFPDGGLIRAAVIGVSGIHKGAVLLKSIIEQNERHMKKNPHDMAFEFHIFGKTDGILPLQSPGVVYHGPYERDLLPEHLDAIKPSFSIIPSIFFETYCHTLTESWSYGIPVFASPIGAIRERISKHGGGWLLDYTNPAKWFMQMMQVARDPEEYQKKIRDIEKMHFKTVQEMTEKYVQVYRQLLQTTRETDS